MADRGDTHYHVPTLNLWFLGSSAFFLLTMVWTVIDDWDAEWKNVQRDFRQLELEVARAEEAQLEAAGAMQTEEELVAQVEAAEQAIEANADELEEAEHDAYVLKEARYVAEEAFKKVKSEQGWQVWEHEWKLRSEKAKLAAKSPQDAEKINSQWLEEKIARYRADVYDLELDFQRADKAHMDAEAKVTALNKAVFDAQANLAAGTRDLARVREKIDSLDPAALDKQAAAVIRDFPGLDFIGPNLKVQKFVMEHITFNLNFTTKPRIDMCTTCHMGIDREGMSPSRLADIGLEDPGQPHTAHPRLDLFLTSKSPHPIKDVGCTVCHRGSGESLSFQHADHRPSNDDEAHDWHEEYHWHKQHHWDYPMLRDKNVEAGCVQCHKTSMELIADDAPELFKGYELFETKGCYACHKVDWFPTKRRPGPDLTNLASKMDPDFVYSWIANPRKFRPKTHMPQVFHLENFDAEEIVVQSNWGGEGTRPIYGEEWNDAAVAAVTSFLFDRHPERALPPVPADMEGDAERGREVMTVTSCFACHNTEPYEDGGAKPPVLSNHSTGNGHGVGKNEMGPDLRGVATKVSKEWLYNWLLNPADYWPETRMPDPRLDEQDALDVATYIMEDPDGIFHDVPDDWAADANWRDHLKLDVLQEQARWFFQKEGRDALEEKIGKGGEWEDLNVLAARIGEAYVTNQGCFSCHTIDGMESMMPIGAELSTWSSKTVDKLDFGQHYLEEVTLPAAFAKENGITKRKLPKLDHHYREGWLERKLSHPRVYDLDKVKTPKDKLRMPWFDLTEEEIDAIATFVLGQVEDEVGQSAMFPTAEQDSIELGKRAVRQNNCMSCHMVEPPTVTFLDDQDIEVTLPAEVIFSADEPLPPRQTSLADLLQDVTAFEELWDEEVSEFTVRLMDVVPEYGIPSEKVFIPRDRLLGVTPGTGGDFIRFINEYYLYGSSFLPNEDFDENDPESGHEYFRATLGYDDDEGNLIEDVDGEQRAYRGNTVDEVRWTFAPPSLFEEGHKLQAPWFYGFLKDPVNLRRQVRVKMPKFHYDAGEAEAIADYFAAKARWEWHARYAKTLRAALGRTIKADLADGSTEHEWDLDRESRTWPTLSFITEHAVMSVEEMAALMASDPTQTWGLKAETIRAIESGSKPDTLASFAKLKAFGDAQGFHMTGPVKEGHEHIVRRTPSYQAELGHLMDLGGNLAFLEGVDGAGRDEQGNALTQAVNCYQCHDNPNDDGQHAGLLPEAFAPSLTHASARLREEWVREWLWNPGLKYPGTKMPANFSLPLHAYDDFYPGSTNESQIEAVLAWLYNLDRPKSK